MGLGRVFFFFFQCQFLGLKFRLSLVELEVKLTRKDFLLLFKLDPPAPDPLHLTP